MRSFFSGLPLALSGFSDSTALIWSAFGQPNRATFPLSDVTLTKLWTDLAANDAKVAFQAMKMLANSPDQATTLFRQYLKPVPQADAKQTSGALRNLDSGAFAARERVMEELGQLGCFCRTEALRRALMPGYQRRSADDWSSWSLDLVERTNVPVTGRKCSNRAPQLEHEVP